MKYLVHDIYIEDGDSKSYPTTGKAQPFGPKWTPSKWECIGDVQKRVVARPKKFRTKHGK